MSVVSQPEASPGRDLLVSEVLRLQYSQKPQHGGCFSRSQTISDNTEPYPLTALTYPCNEPGFGLGDLYGSLPTWDTLGFTSLHMDDISAASSLGAHHSHEPLLFTQCILTWERSAATQLQHQHHDPDPLLNHFNLPALTLRR